MKDRVWQKRIRRPDADWWPNSARCPVRPCLCVRESLTRRAEWKQQLMQLRRVSSNRPMWDTPPTTASPDYGLRISRSTSSTPQHRQRSKNASDCWQVALAVCANCGSRVPVDGDVDLLQLPVTLPTRPPSTDSESSSTVHTRDQAAGPSIGATQFTLLGDLIA